MIKIKTKKQIIEILNNQLFMDFDYNNKTIRPIGDKDIYIYKGWLFVNMTATKSVYKYSGIDVYKYPLNEYCESYTSLWNIHNKPFKEYIKNNINFEGEYPMEINPPKIKYINRKGVK